MDVRDDSRDALMDRVRGEYREMPGLHLTLRQAQRLWGMDSLNCRALLDTLVRGGFLVRSEEGAYHRPETEMLVARH